MPEYERYMAATKVGPKGQIVIPKEIRDMLGFQPGDSLVLLADRTRGLAVVKQESLHAVADAIFSGQGAEQHPGESAEHLSAFAEAIRQTEQEGSTAQHECD